MVSTILFTDEQYGYNKEQVDGYISKLSRAYQAAYNDNQEIQEKYNSLLDDCKKLENQGKAKINADVITKTMLNLETLAQKIISEAQDEVVKAKEEAQSLTDAAYAEASNVRAAAQALIDEANGETARARAAAQKIRDEANTEAARIISRARRNADQAHEIMRQTLTRLQDLLAYDESDREVDMAV